MSYLGTICGAPGHPPGYINKAHFATVLCRYGGNPVCSAGGRAVLRVIDAEQRQAHCADVGEYLKARLQQLATKHDIIGDVRGQGLMLGVELVKDRTTKVGCSWILFWQVAWFCLVV